MTAMAIDWSGAKKAGEKIWIAVADAGALVRLEPARSREDAVDALIEHLARDRGGVAGLDFAFSMPAWFLEERGLAEAFDLWALAAREGEAWLSECDAPFWGRTGKKRPSEGEPLRRTDREPRAVAGIRPKSVFQIGGAGAVGTGSIRGMPFLSRIRDAGIAVWPFDGWTRPMVVEIYPRLLTGPVVKSSYWGRADYLAEHYPDLERGCWGQAVTSEDAFDAAVSALKLEESLARAEVPRLDEVSRLEGAIWPAT